MVASAGGASKQKKGERENEKAAVYPADHEPGADAGFRRVGRRPDYPEVLQLGRCR